MATSNKASATAEPEASDADFAEAEDLFGDKTAGSDDDWADADDLLNSVQEDDSEGWVPTERGESVAGVVIKVGEVKSDFDDDLCPTVTIKTKEGDKFRVIGYGAVLKRELADAKAQVGDLIAVKYWGERTLKKGKFAGRPYKHYSVAVKHR